MAICDGEIKGDPDIAGIGVVLAVFINSAFSMVLSTILWVYVFSKGYNRLGQSDEHPWWIPALRDTLVMQGDSQLISGLAIIIASLVNIYRDDETPLYHIFVARGLAEVCLSGHVSTIALLPRTEHDWTFRLFLVFVCIVLWEYWSWVAIEKFRQWNWETPRCLENENIFGGDYEDWIIFSLVWMPLSYTTIYLNEWQWGSEITDQFENWITAFPNIVIKRIRKSFKSLSALDIFENAAITSILTTLCLVFLAFAIMIPSSRTLLPLQTLISIWWNAYDIAKVRAANARIVVANPQYRSDKSFQNNDNPEHDWGFGQILPFVMLLLPILTALDFMKRAYGEDKNKKGQAVASLTTAATSGQQTQQGISRRRTALWPATSH